MALVSVRNAGLDGGAIRKLKTAVGNIIPINNTYLFLPLNESSTSHTAYGGLSSSVVVSAGGSYTTSRTPYSIDSTSPYGTNTSCYYCNGENSTFQVSSSNNVWANMGTSDFCIDFWFYWVQYGNGGGSYGYIGDFNFQNGTYFPRSGQGSSSGSYVVVGAVGNNTIDNTGIGSHAVNGLGVWSHLLVLRQSQIKYSFLNGVLADVGSDATSYTNGGTMTFGVQGRPGHWWAVNLADVMITRSSNIQYNVSNITSSDLGTTYFTPPEYKNKRMAIPSASNFTVVNLPDSDYVAT